MCVTLSRSKALKLQLACQQVLDKKRLTIWDMAQILGSLSATSPGNRFAKLYAKKMETDKTRALSTACGNYDARCYLSAEAKIDVLWWITNIQHVYRPILIADPAHVLYTDASHQGWGRFYTNTKLSEGGRWTPEENCMHINYLELLAVLYSLRSHLHQVSDCHVRVFTDNTVTMLCINQQGSTHSDDCNNISRSIWEWCIERNIWLSLAFCPGKENVKADKASRVFNDETEWQLDRKIFKRICKVFGKPEIDLFASRLNRQVKTYCAWHPVKNKI